MQCSLLLNRQSQRGIVLLSLGIFESCLNAHNGSEIQILIAKRL